MKSFKIAVSIGLVAMSLTACAPTSSKVSCSSDVSAGSVAAQVHVTGEILKKPTVSFTKGLTSGTVEAAAVITGSGPVVQLGQSVAIEASLYSGATGELLKATSYDGTSRPTIPLNVSLLGGLAKSLQCQTVGSRVVAVIGNDEALASSLGLTKAETVVAVVDIARANLEKSNGVSQPVPDGLPRVILSESGVPGITVPSASAPTALSVTVLKKGSGSTVRPTSTVTLHYVGTTWSKNSVSLGSSWKTGSPINFDSSNTITGFWKALEGQTVGSQILAIVPPALGYKDKPKGDIPPNSTLIFVIDILGVSP